MMWFKILVIILLIGGLIMPHGQPDFGMYGIAETIYRLADMGELAARLGSIDTFDRRGDVVWLDGFEDNINKWIKVLVGTGAAAVLSTEAARNGARSCKLTTGSAANNYAYIERYSPYPILSKVGFEISFTLDADLSYIYLYLLLYDGTNRYQAWVMYCPNTDKLYYVDVDGNAQLLGSDLNLFAWPYAFHTGKLVADLKTMKYVRLILNERTYDLSSYELYPVEDDTAPGLRAAFWAITGVAANKSIYADDAIITQNEP